MNTYEPEKKASFLVICRSNYFNDVRPADKASQKSSGYTEAVALAKTYFETGNAEEFRKFLKEGKYLADLWAAHLILEWGQPHPSQVNECLDIIERHAASPFDPALAKQERRWLNDYSKAKQGAG
jgi:hypothetical protein